MKNKRFLRGTLAFKFLGAVLIWLGGFFSSLFTKRKPRRFKNVWKNDGYDESIENVYPESKIIFIGVLFTFFLMILIYFIKMELI
jgi:hypothetical protein